MLVKFIVLIGLVQLLRVTDKPLLCSGIYTIVGLLFGLMFAAGGHVSIPSLLVMTLVRFLLSSVYFWLLWRVDRGLLYWIVLVVGLFIGLV